MSNAFCRLGIVKIGKGLGEEAPFSGDSKRSTKHKATGSPPRNPEPGLVFVTF